MAHVAKGLALLQYLDIVADEEKQQRKEAAKRTAGAGSGSVNGSTGSNGSISSATARAKPLSWRERQVRPGLRPSRVCTRVCNRCTGS